MTGRVAGVVTGRRGRVVTGRLEGVVIGRVAGVEAAPTRPRRDGRAGGGRAVTGCASGGAP